MLLTILTAGVVNVFEALLYQAKSDEQNTRAAARFGNEVGKFGLIFGGLEDRLHVRIID